MIVAAEATATVQAGRATTAASEGHLVRSTFLPRNAANQRVTPAKSGRTMSGAASRRSMVR